MHLIHIVLHHNKIEQFRLANSLVIRLLNESISILAMVIPMTIIVLGFEVILTKVTKIETMEAITAIIVIGVIKLLIVLKKDNKLALDLSLYFE